jgi:cytochrome bd ubiquinol oxidase subunit II
VSAATFLAGTLVVALNAYVLLGGADFGGGVWDLLARGPCKEAQRQLIAQAIGPVWEANHVWLILAIVLLFTCFPAAFARLVVPLNLPLTGVLIGIVLRGSAFAFRGYGGDRDAVQRRWGRVFAVASLVTPLLLGTALGAVASGAVGIAATAGGPAASFAAQYIMPWLAPFPLSVGLVALACFAFLAATYLTLEAPAGALREDFRRRAIGSGIAVGGAALVALVTSGSSAPLMRHGLAGSDWALPFQLLTGLVAIGALAALVRRRYALARLAAMLQVSLVLWGWAWSQYPYVVPPDLDIAAAAAPTTTLELVIAALVLGALVLVPSLFYLFRVFKGGDQLSTISHP